VDCFAENLAVNLQEAVFKTISRWPPTSSARAGPASVQTAGSKPRREADQDDSHRLTLALAVRLSCRTGTAPAQSILSEQLTDQKNVIRSRL
jgi:hypothetical protein